MAPKPKRVKNKDNARRAKKKISILTQESVDYVDYKDINLLGLRLLRPGGLLMTYSCSGGIGLDLFQKIVAGAARDAGREARIVRRLSGSADHPVALNFPEGEYLKGLLVQAD